MKIHKTVPELLLLAKICTKSFVGWGFAPAHGSLHGYRYGPVIHKLRYVTVKATDGALSDDESRSPLDK